jgi:outer membrane protein assembly factor BamB
VVVAPGGPGDKALVAYDAATGEPRWSAGDDTASYASPALLEVAGRRQIVSRNQTSITGHDPETGEQLWSQPWPGNQPNVAQPVPIGDDKLLVSSGYGIGASLFRIVPEGEGYTVEEVWANLSLKAKFANFVVHDGNVYGLDDGILVCLDPETGERHWKRGRYGHGQLMLVEDLLLLIAEDGDLFLVEASPEGLDEVAVLEGALDGKSWNNPALSEDRLLLRNAETAVAYRLPTVG